PTAPPPPAPLTPAPAGYPAAWRQYAPPNAVTSSPAAPSNSSCSPLRSQPASASVVLAVVFSRAHSTPTTPTPFSTNRRPPSPPSALRLASQAPCRPCARRPANITPR